MIEYKGPHLIDLKQTQQKDSVGHLWEEKSDGKGLFLMVEKEKNGLVAYEQMRKKFERG